MEKKIKIKQVRSSIGRLKKQKATLVALGLTRMNQSVVKNDIPQIRGMIRIVNHLVKVEAIN